MNAHLPISDDPVLARLRTALEEMYGANLVRVILYGSRAKGTASPGSDYDVAVFLKSFADRWTELTRLADLRVDMIDETGAFVEARPYRASAIDDATPLMHEIRRTGIDL